MDYYISFEICSSINPLHIHIVGSIRIKALGQPEKLLKLRVFDGVF